MDELQEYEIPFLLSNIDITEKQDWIRTRYILWATLKPHLKHQHTKPEDIFPLPWDNNSISTHIDATEEQRKSYMESLKKFNPFKKGSN